MTKTRILVVENEVVVAEDIKHKLEILGYEVPAIALSGEEAVKFTATIRPDLILTDIRMPGKWDGVDAAMKIKEFLDIPVVFITAFADKETINRAKVVEPFGYILKPFVELELQKTVEIALYSHRMERELRESEAKYRTLVETTDTGFLILDALGRVIDANPEYVRLSGHREIREILGRCVTEWTAGGTKQKNAEAVVRCARDRRIRNFVIEYVDDRGRITPVEINATVHGEGESLRIISLCRDITERRQAEKKLQESEEKYRALVENINDVIFSVNAQGIITFINGVVERMIEYKPEEMVGQPFAKFIYSRDLPALTEQFRLVMGGKIGPDEYRLVTKSGEIRWVRSSSRPIIENDKAVGIQGVGTDITERKRAEEARQRQNRYDALRANIWKLVADKTISGEKLIDGLLEYTGPALGVSRACYNVFEHGDPEHDDVVCTHEWCAAGISPSLGSRLPSAIARHFFHREGELLDGETALAKSSALVRPLLKPVIEMYQKVYNIEAIFVLPFPQEGAMEGVLTFDVCRNQAVKPAFSVEDRAIVRDVASIVASHLLRRRAEEELRQKTAVLEAQIDSTIDGILIVDEKGNKIIQNRRCIELWKIPKDIAANQDAKQQLEFVKNRTRDPKAFTEKVLHLHSHPAETAHDEVEFKDGMILDRYSAPVVGKDGTYFGRIWVFRDISGNMQVSGSKQTRTL